MMSYILFVILPTIPEHHCLTSLRIRLRDQLFFQVVHLTSVAITAQTSVYVSVHSHESYEIGKAIFVVS